MGLYAQSMDRLADLPVKGKLYVFFLGLVILPYIVLLLLLSSHEADQVSSVLAIALAAAIILFVPLSNWLAEVLALRNTRRLNEVSRKLQEGVYELEGDLGRAEPSEGETQKNDFRQLKHNVYWMARSIGERETRIQSMLSDLRAAQRQVEESLDYAALIQSSVVSGAAALKAAFPGSLALSRQRDAVGGDMLWCRETGAGFWLGVIDCTGHGVPGAFMTLITASVLDQAVGEVRDPAELLARLNTGLRAVLGKDGTTRTEQHTDDGCDAGFCLIPVLRELEDGLRVNPDGELLYAGARLPLFVQEGGVVRRVAGSGKGVGYLRTPPGEAYPLTRVALSETTRLFMATDGLFDQVGGEKGLPYGKKRFESLLVQYANESPAALGPLIEADLVRHAGRQERRDDVTVAGMACGPTTRKK